MDRQTLLSIMAALPDSALIQSLAAAGVNIAGQGSSMTDDMAAGNNQMEAYNDVMVDSPGSDSPRPPIFSGQNFIKQKVAQGMAMAGGNPGAQAQGGPATPYLDPNYDKDSDLNFLALQQSRGMA